MLAWLNPEHWTWLNPEHWWPDNPPVAPTRVNPQVTPSLASLLLAEARWENIERQRVRSLLFAGTSVSAVQRIRTDAAHPRALPTASTVELKSTGIRWVKRPPNGAMP